MKNTLNTAAIAGALVVICYGFHLIGYMPLVP